MFSCDVCLGLSGVQNVCGMSVVGSDFDRLKRYNLAEIYDPTPKPAAKVEQSGSNDCSNDGDEVAAVSL